ncbi:hypothetical protein [Roseobacter weihaiensis]|uniref:hypothetical protein n=1 Tax=Roseobacter weihaiensis TaxID=2763262 RepID=UPI001D0AEF67|nr:hypothetical protein [Roseobacter sp. H9]
MGDTEFQEFLDAISTCFIDRDFATWRDRVIYPFTLITAAGPVLIRDEDELRENFNLYLQACEAMHLDKIYRRPVALEACSDGTWIGTYETNLLSRGVRAAEPYVSSALLRESDGRFKMMSIMNARGHHDWTGKQPG